VNSWGASNDPGQLRSSGITRDGMFKMQMGLAGVGTPDATYSVACYPAESTQLHPHSDQPWTRNRRRFLTPQKGDTALLGAACYSYTIRKGDTVSDIVDHFGLDMRQVIFGCSLWLDPIWACSSTNGSCTACLISGCF
jgi:hypothetical protein